MKRYMLENEPGTTAYVTKKNKMPSLKVTDGYVFFWKPNDENGLLSNWTAHEIKTSDMIFRTAEHVFMYQKAKIMGDDISANRIYSSSSPIEAKKLGRQVRNWNEAKWLSCREQIMLDTLWLKATQHEDARLSLLSTGESVIAECSPYDCIWGIGLHATNRFVQNQRKWKGLNLLGEKWMKVRDILRISNDF